MKLLVKLGGTLLDSAESRTAISAQLATAVKQHPQTVVVHGGGKQMTRYLTDHNVESKFVNGLRVTSPEVVDALLKVFAGTVNHLLVSSLVSQGVDAVGLSGIDAGLTEAVQLNPKLGAVGKVTKANPKVLDVLTAGGFVPVVACVAGDRMGNIYNVNADQMAVACAAGFGAGKLLFLTDVDGVRAADGKVIPVLTMAESRKLIQDGIATGGMQAKLNAAEAALTAGVSEVLIAQGGTPGILQRLLSDEAVGTKFVR